MKTRKAVEEDIPQLREIYAARGFDWSLPSLDDLIVADVAMDEEGEVLAFAGAEPIAEVFLLCDARASPVLRIQAIAALHESLRVKVAAAGIKCAMASLSPEIDKRFGSRLRRSFGWVKGDSYMNWYRKV